MDETDKDQLTGDSSACESTSPNDEEGAALVETTMVLSLRTLVVKSEKISKEPSFDELELEESYLESVCWGFCCGSTGSIIEADREVSGLSSKGFPDSATGARAAGVDEEASGGLDDVNKSARGLGVGSDDDDDGEDDDDEEDDVGWFDPKEPRKSTGGVERRAEIRLLLLKKINNNKK